MISITRIILCSFAVANLVLGSANAASIRGVRGVSNLMAKGGPKVGGYPPKKTAVHNWTSLSNSSQDFFTKNSTSKKSSFSLRSAKWSNSTSYSLDDKKTSKSNDKTRNLETMFDTWDLNDTLYEFEEHNSTEHSTFDTWEFNDTSYDLEQYSDTETFTSKSKKNSYKSIRGARSLLNSTKSYNETSHDSFDSSDDVHSASKRSKKTTLGSIRGSAHKNSKETSIDLSDLMSNSTSMKSTKKSKSSLKDGKGTGKNTTSRSGFKSSSSKSSFKVTKGSKTGGAHNESYADSMSWDV